MNVQRWPILITSLLLTSGCASFLNWLEPKPEVKPVEVISKPAERTPLSITDPAPIRAKPIQWVVITRENINEVFDKLEQQGVDAVVFAITDDGYKQLSITFAELRNLINTQRNIIIKYKDYYEPSAKAEK